MLRAIRLLPLAVFAVAISMPRGLASQTFQTLDLTRVGTDPHWRVAGRTTSVVEMKGKGAALKVNEGPGMGLVWFDGFVFTNGTIDLDVLGRSAPVQGSFVGVAFHVANSDRHEAIYFRPFNFRSPDSAAHAHAVQYVSHPQWPWQVLRASNPGQYERAIAPAPNGDEWFHVRVVINRPKVSVFVNGSERPALTVEELGGLTNGSVGIWVGEGSGGYFTNLRVAP